MNYDPTNLASDWNTWKLVFGGKDQRFGQYWWNQHGNNLTNRKSWSELFFEVDHAKAYAMICKELWPEDF